jgi:hypothetical protein
MSRSRQATFSSLQSIFSDKTAQVYDFDDRWNYRVRSQLKDQGLDLDVADQVFNAYETNPWLQLAVETGGGSTGVTEQYGFNPFTGARPKTRTKTIENAVGLNFAGTREGRIQFNREGTFMAQGADPFKKLREAAFRDQRNFAGYETEDFLGQTVARRQTKQLRKDRDIVEKITNNKRHEMGQGQVRFDTSVEEVTHKVGSEGYEEAWKRANEALYGGSTSDAEKKAAAAKVKARQAQQRNPFSGGQNRALEDVAPEFSIAGLEEGEDNFEIQDEYGYLVNDAFLSGDLAGHESFTDQHREVFGLTADQAKERDPVLKAASEIQGAGQQTYKAWRDSQKGGGFFKKALGVIAPIAGNFLLPGIGGAIGGALGGVLHGGDLGDILKGAALGGLSGGSLGNILKGTSIGANIGSGATSALNIAGGGLKAGLEGGNLQDILLGGFSGGVDLGGRRIIKKSGSGNMSILGDLFGAVKSGASKLFGGGGLGGLLSKGYEAIGGTKGIMGGLGSILSGDHGLINSGSEYLANKEAARTQQKGQDQAIGLADPMARYRPQFAGQLASLMADPSKAMSMDPSAQFRMEQGQQALNRKLNAGGDRLSGKARLANVEYGQKFASQVFNEQFNRLNTLATGSATAGNIQAGAATSGAENKLNQYEAIMRGGSTIGGILGDILNKGRTGAALPNAGSNANAPFDPNSSGSVWNNPY